MAKRFRFRHVNEVAGTFVILTMVATIVLLFFAAREQHWFEPKYKVRTVLPEEGSYGLRIGADVQLLHAIAGRVQEITINDKGRLEAVFSIRREFFQFVREDSVALIREKFGLVAGDVYLEITRGKGEQLPRKNAAIPCEVDKGFTIVLEEVMGQFGKVALPAIQEFAGLAAELRNPNGPLQQLLTRINRIADSLDQGEGVAAKLLTDKALGEEMEKTLVGVNTVLGEMQIVFRDAQKTSGKIADMADGVGEQLAAMPRLVSQTEKTLAEVQVVMQDLHQAMAGFPGILRQIEDEMEVLPGLVLQTKETLQQMEKLVVGMQKHWLLRGYLEQEESTPRIPPEEINAVRTQP